MIHWTPLLSQEVTPAKNGEPPTEREVARGENYLVYVYRKTELQDYLIGKSKKNRREDYKAYVIVDGPSMVNQDGFIDPDSLDWAKIATEMRRLRVDGQSVASFHVLAGGGPSNSPTLTWLLEGFGRNRCRFDHVYWKVSSHSGDFWSKVEASQKLARDTPAGPESGIGNELLRVFPVQSFLSRFNSGDADCVVRVIPQLVKKANPQLRGAIQASMLKYVPMLETKRKKKLLLLINYHTDAQESIDWLWGAGAGILAEKLGYEEVTAQAAEYSFLLKGDD